MLENSKGLGIEENPGIDPGPHIIITYIFSLSTKMGLSKYVFTF